MVALITGRVAEIAGPGQRGVDEPDPGLGRADETASIHRDGLYMNLWDSRQTSEDVSVVVLTAIVTALVVGVLFGGIGLLIYGPSSRFPIVFILVPVAICLALGFWGQLAQRPDSHDPSIPLDRDLFYPCLCSLAVAGYLIFSTIGSILSNQEADTYVPWHTYVLWHTYALWYEGLLLMVYAALAGRVVSSFEGLLDFVIPCLLGVAISRIFTTFDVAAKNTLALAVSGIVTFILSVTLFQKGPVPPLGSGIFGIGVLGLFAFFLSNSEFGEPVSFQTPNFVPLLIGLVFVRLGLVIARTLAKT